MLLPHLHLLHSYHDSIGVAVPPFNITGLSWVTPLRNFDNFAVSLWVLFVMSLQENWSEVRLGWGMR